MTWQVCRGEGGQVCRGPTTWCPSMAQEGMRSGGSEDAHNRWALSTTGGFYTQGPVYSAATAPHEPLGALPLPLLRPAPITLPVQVREASASALALVCHLLSTSPQQLLLRSSLSRGVLEHVGR